MDRMRTIDATERRARLARRQRLAPGARTRDVAEAARSLVCLHGTDPATVYLAARARLEEMAIADMDRALYEDRTLIKHIAMRRTLFVFPREALGYAQAGASNAVAQRERRRLIKEVEAAGLQKDGAAWLNAAADAVLRTLSDGRQATWSELREELPVLAGSLTYGEGRSWGGKMAVGPRVLTVLSAAGQIVRASNVGGWTSSRPRWSSMAHWLGAPLEPPSEVEGVAWLVREWLRAFGPGPVNDIKWWLGSTVAAVRRALADVHAVEVDLDGRTGYVLPDDVEPAEPVEPWAALLPPLDPTTMGWSERDWYLGPHKGQIFDTAGNAGPTIWWDGRIVGGWRQTETGEVVLQLLEDVGADARRAITDEADRLDGFLAGTRVLPRFPSPLWREASALNG
jgi:hypothetical protein